MPTTGYILSPRGEKVVQSFSTRPDVKKEPTYAINQRGNFLAFAKEADVLEEYEPILKVSKCDIFDCSDFYDF